MIQEVMDAWRETIEADDAYQLALKKTKPGKKNRQEILAAAVDPYEQRIRQALKDRQLGKEALDAHLGRDEAAFRAHAFGADFVLSISVPGFDALEDEEKERLRYEQAIFFSVWNTIYRDLMAPEFHQAA